MSIMAVDINNRFYYDSMKVTVIRNTAFPGNVNVTPTKLTTAVHTYIICTKKTETSPRLTLLLFGKTFFFSLIEKAE